MNFSTSISILLSVPALGFVPNSSFKKSNKQARHATEYYEDETVLENPAVGWFFLDDAYTTALKQHLKISEEDIQRNYSSWLMKYNKVADDCRYMTYKKNFLMQEEYNKKFKSSFTVNEFADMTETEYRKMKTGELALPSLEEEMSTLHEMKTEDCEIDKKDEILVEKCKPIEDVEELASEALVLRISKPVGETPKLRLEGGATCMNALHKPELSAIEGFASLHGYLSSMVPNESGTFEEGKIGAKLGSSALYLDGICGMLEPFMDCGKERTPN